MPYILLALGLLLGLYGLYRFFLNADAQQVRALILTVAILVMAVALFYLTVTGRFAVALGLIAAALPFIGSYLQKRRQQTRAQTDGHGTPPSAPGTGRMTEVEALEILDLTAPADKKAIEAAYKKLMKKVHPDQEGSQWMATKLNQARDTLLRK